MEVLNVSGTNTSFNSETTALLEETKALLRLAPEGTTLKRHAKAYEDICDEYEAAAAMGTKAMIRAAAQAESVLARNASKNDEVERFRNRVRELERRINETRSKTSSNEAKLEAAVKETEELKEEEARIEKEWEALGGEKEVKKREELAKASTDAPLLKRAVNLYRNITRIKFDFAGGEAEMKGFVVDSKLGQVAQFRFPLVEGGANEFATANRIWSVVG